MRKGKFYLSRHNAQFPLNASSDRSDVIGNDVIVINYLIIHIFNYDIFYTSHIFNYTNVLEF